MALAEQIQKAREAGYADDEIVGHLRPRLEEQVKAAGEAGYEPAAVREHLASQGVPEPVAFDLTASAPEKAVRAAGPALKALAEPFARAREALAAPIEAPGEAFDALGRRLRAGAEQEIPGLKQIAEMQSRGPENAAMVAQAVAEAGYPRLAVPAGVLAGAPTVASQVLTPVPATVGEAEVAAALAIGTPLAARAGNALPILGEALPPAEYIGNVLRRRLGLGDPTGLTRVDPAEALAAGRMSTAQAARQSPDIYAAELAKRGLQGPGTGRPVTLRTAAEAEGGGTVGAAPRPEAALPVESAPPAGPIGGAIPPPATPRLLATPGTAGAPPPILKSASPESIPARSTPVNRGVWRKGIGDLEDVLEEGARSFKTTPDDPSLPAYIADQARKLSGEIAPELERLAPSLPPNTLSKIRDSVARDIQRLRSIGVESPEAWHAAVRKADERLLAPPQERGTIPIEADLLSNKQIELQTGRKVWQLTPEEYKAAAPGNPIEDHRDAVFNAMWRKQDVPRNIVDSYPELEADLKQREFLQEYAQETGPGGGARITAMDIARNMGINQRSYEKYYRGELKSLEDSPAGRFIIRGEGRSIDDLAERAWEEGLIPENDPQAFVALLNDEIRTSGIGEAGGQPPLRRGQGGFAALGGAPPPAGPPVPPDVAAYKAKIHTFKKPGRTIAQTFEDLYTEAVDRNNPLLNLAKQATEAVHDTKNVRFTIDRYMGSSGIADQWLTTRTTRLQPDGTVVSTGEGLKPILREFDDAFARRFGVEAMDDLKAYMLAQRDLEVVGRGIHGLDPKRAPDVISFMEQKYGGKIAPFADRIRAWEDRAFLQTLQDAGVISEASAAAIRAKGKFYVPYDRIIDQIDPEGAARFASGNPIKKLSGSEREVYDPFEKMIAQAYRTAEFADRNRIGQSVADLSKQPGALKDLVKEVGKSGPETVTVFFNGSKRFFKIQPEAKDALDNLQAAGLGMVAKILSFPATLSRAGITMDPQFSIIRNPLRDQLTAAMHARHGYVPVVDFFRGIFHAIGRTELYEEWLAAGGSNSAMVGIDRMDATTTLRKLRGLRELDHINPVSWLQKIGEAGEVGTRMGVFARARAAGASALEAMYESKESTINFGIKPRSTTMRFLNSATAFMRPGILSDARFFRAFKEAPGRTSTRAVSLITLPSLALWYVNKDNKEYKELPLWQKNLFWHIPVGNRLVPIPKPFEYGILFGSGPERALDWIYKKDPQAIESFGLQLWDALTPPITPSILAPALAAQADYNPFTGRPIVPKSRAGLLPKDQYGEFTTETAKELGKRFDYPPSKIDYLIGGYGGTLARRMVNLGIDPAIIESRETPGPPKPERPFEDLVLARRAIGSNSESVNRFYEYLTQMEQAHNSLNANMQGVKVDAGPMLGLFRTTQAQINEIKRMEKMVGASKMAPDSKRALLNRYDKIVTNLASTMVRTYEGQSASGRQVR